MLFHDVLRNSPVEDMPSFLPTNRMNVYDSNDEDLNDRVDDSSLKPIFNNLEFVCFVTSKLTKPMNANDSLISVRKFNGRNDKKLFFYSSIIHTDCHFESQD